MSCTKAEWSRQGDGSPIAVTSAPQGQMIRHLGSRRAEKPPERERERESPLQRQQQEQECGTFTCHKRLKKKTLEVKLQE